MNGVRRTLGVAPTQKKGITTGDIKADVAALPPGLAGHCDRLLLTLGFAGGFRRSELAGITVVDVEQVAEGLPVPLDRSKTDQEGKGRRVRDRLWHRRRHLHRPGLAHLAHRLGHHHRPHLPPDRPPRPAPRPPLPQGGRHRRQAPHGPPRPHHRRLCRPQPPPRHATTAARNGASERTIMRTTGHTSTQTVRGYIEDGELFSNPASKYLGL